MVTDFAFLDGTLDVVHRRRDAGDGWVEGAGTIRAQRLLRLEPPVHGRFGPDGVGTFLGAEGDQLVRFTWSDAAGDRPRWLQELSADGGRTWVRDWEMAFRPREEAA